MIPCVHAYSIGAYIFYALRDSYASFSALFGLWHVASPTPFVSFLLTVHGKCTCRITSDYF